MGTKTADTGNQQQGCNKMEELTKMFFESQNGDRTQKDLDSVICFMMESASFSEQPAGERSNFTSFMLDLKAFFAKASLLCERKGGDNVN